MVGEMHKETQQAAGGLTSLGATSEEGSHLQLCSGCRILIIEHDMDKGTKNYSIDHIFTGTKPSVLVDQTKSTGDGLKTAYTDSDESEEEKEFAEDKDTHASSHDVPEDTSIPHPPSLKSAQIQELMAQWSFKLYCSRFCRYGGKCIHKQSTKESCSACQATASPAEGEKNTTKDAETNLQNELVDLLGIDVVEQYHNKKLLFDKYCDKMLKRRKSSKIINLTYSLAAWREVVTSLSPDRKEKDGNHLWIDKRQNGKTFDQIERELRIDFNKPLKEQDPLNELNELAYKKRI
ncbi:hypothetical protein Tco_1023118 [Tanacetum coccineum]